MLLNAYAEFCILVHACWVTLSIVETSSTALFLLGGWNAVTQFRVQKPASWCRSAVSCLRCSVHFRLMEASGTNSRHSQRHSRSLSVQASSLCIGIVITATMCLCSLHIHSRHIYLGYTSYTLLQPCYHLLMSLPYCRYLAHHELKIYHYYYYYYYNDYYD